MDSSLRIEDNSRSSCGCSIVEDSHAVAFGIDCGAYRSGRHFEILDTRNTFLEEFQYALVRYSRGHATVIRILRFLRRGTELSPRISIVRYPVSDHLNQLTNKGRLTRQH